MRVFSIVIMCFFYQFLQGQIDNKFRYGSVHNIKERNSYSIFYPVEQNTYRGLVILIHSQQASNPKAYGLFIEQLLKSGNIVIYPGYQSFGVSKNSEDLQFISMSLKNAYEDIKKNYPKVMNLPVAFIGHSMGGIIVMELAAGIVDLPKKPTCVISICPAEVSNHKIDKINFSKIDSYDFFLVIEEEKDKYFKRKTGYRLIDNLSAAKRKKHIVHYSSKEQKSKHLNLWAFDEYFSSKNNSLVSYFSKLLGKKNITDTDFYWPNVISAIDCAFTRSNCEKFDQVVEDVDDDVN